VDAGVVNGRDVGAVSVMLRVTGELPDKVEIHAQSVPPLAEEQIYALLGAEELAGLASGGETESLGDVMGRQFVVALGAAFRHYIFQPLTEDIKQLLGLSMLEVSFAFDQPVQVKIGKYVVKDLLVTYETQTLAANDQWDLQVSYEITDQYRVSYQTDETSNNRMFVEYVRTF